MKNQKSPSSLNDVLNSCIEIKSTRVNRKVTIPSQIYFHLNAELLAQIPQLKASGTKFSLSAGNLANLRHYALLNLPLKQQRTWRQSALTFSTAYSFADDFPATTLFRSVIDLEGKISQQIKQELAENPLLLEQISEAHYWLIAEILAQLPVRAKAWYSKLIFACLAIATTIIIILIWYLIPLKLIAYLSILCLLTSVAKIWLTKQVKSWIINHLLDGLLANSTIKRKLGWYFLGLVL